MNELLRRLATRPAIAAELILASLFANLLALASPLFVIQVLNRYVTYGVDATLATLCVGVLAAIGLEFTFRQARLMLAADEMGDVDRERSEGAYGMLIAARRAALDRLPPGQRRETLRGLEAVETAFSPPNLGALLDLPFAVMFLGALTLLSPLLGLIALVFIAMVLVFGILAQRRLRKPTRDLMNASGIGNALAAVTEQGADTVRAFNGADLMMTSWRTYLEKAQALRKQIAGNQGWSQSVTQSAQAVMGVAIIAVGAMRVVAGDLDTGTLIGANLLAARALGPVSRVAQLGQALARATQALARVEALAHLPAERDQGAALTVYAGGLELRDLAFAHPGAPAPLFESLSLALPPGSVLVVTGRNGSGKTTLARLILGLLEPTRGHVLADGVDLRQAVPAWWRRQVVYLPQEPTFLPGTIRENLLAANPALTDANLDRLVREAGLRRFIDESAEGLDTPLHDDGMGIARGLRRRLALARGLATDGMLVVLDEPTEGLDDEGRTAVYAVLKTLSERGRTIIAFTHDPVILGGARLVLDLNAKPVPRLLGTPPARQEAAS